MGRIEVVPQILRIIKKNKYVLLILGVGILLMCLPSAREQDSTPEPTQAVTEALDIQGQLEQILCQISGAGKVKVLLTELSGRETVYQTDGDKTTGQDSESLRSDTVIISDSGRGESGLVVRVDPPAYLGAVVVCQGGDQAAVRLAVVEAVSNATGLSTDRISVFKMK